MHPGCVCKKEKRFRGNSTLEVMASHGKGALREFFVGSVTNYCVRNCSSPLIVYNMAPEMTPRAEREEMEDAAAADVEDEEDKEKGNKAEDPDDLPRII